MDIPYAREKTDLSKLNYYDRLPQICELLYAILFERENFGPINMKSEITDHGLFKRVRYFYPIILTSDLESVFIHTFGRRDFFPLGNEFRYRKVLVYQTASLTFRLMNY